MHLMHFATCHIESLRLGVWLSVSCEESLAHMLLFCFPCFHAKIFKLTNASECSRAVFYWFPLWDPAAMTCTDVLKSVACDNLQVKGRNCEVICIQNIVREILIDIVQLRPRYFATWNCIQRQGGLLKVACRYSQKSTRSLNTTACELMKSAATYLSTHVEVFRTCRSLIKLVVGSKFYLILRGTKHPPESE